MHGGNVWQGGAPGAWLDYSANLRPEGPPEWVREALNAALAEVRYYPDLHMRRAREGLAAFLGLDPACVLPTAGGIAAIGLVDRLDAPRVVTATPCFGEYEALAALLGKEARRVPLNLDGGGTPARALQGACDKGDLVWLCNPHNPTGTASGAMEARALLDEVEAASGWLAVDEAFIDYCPAHSVRGWVEAHPRLVVVGSLTKVLAIPGARLGYICAAPETIETLRGFQMPWSLNCFAAAVAAALPGHGADVQEEARKNGARREKLRWDLEALGARVYPSEAPFLLADFGTAVAPLAAALKRRGILVRECMDFAGIDDGNHLRLAVKDEKSNARLVQALREAMTCAENP